MPPARSFPLLAILLTAAAFGSVRSTGELATFYAPTFGHEYEGFSGAGFSGAIGAEYDFNDSKFDEYAVAQLEGVYLHGGGDNDLGGVRHHETLDAGLLFLNGGIGIRRGNWAFACIVGAGRGAGDLQGEITRGDTALEAAFQVKPRISRRFARNWSWFAEYRYIATSDVFGEFFKDDDRALRLHGVGLGVTRRF